jgi:hypothetical protein
MESLEDKREFLQQKQNQLNSEVVLLSPEDVEQLSFAEVQSIEGARACLVAFF